ncbi:MAG: peptidyl-prolyl cis-trans isomerase [Sulfurimicrobium sp.]|nr:peptidyl-prolyl cis-trans isomerase [Sulfurimicrobium sp.]
MMSIKSRILLASAASLLTLSACNADESAKTATPAAKDTATAAATVNGTAISKNRVELLVKQRAGMGQPDNAETRKSIIDQLAMQLLVSQEALKKGLDKTPEVMDQIDLTKQSILANAFVQDYIKNHPVSDDMLKAEYDKTKSQMSGNEYKARHILVEKEADAKDIIAKLKKDIKAFDKLAKDKSKDPGSKAQGGDLGWFDMRSMVPEFGEAVAKLEKGKFTVEPVKTQFGYHVIMLEDSRPLQAPSFEQVKPGLSQQVQQQNLKKLVDDMRAAAKIEIMDAPAPAAAPAK